MNPRFLIVGAGGFLASHAVNHLARSGTAEVVTVGRGKGPGKGESRHHSIDCGDCDALAGVVEAESPDRILNLCGSSGPDFGEMLRYNVGVSETLLGSAARLRKHPPIRVVLAGSAAEFGNPGSLPVTEGTPLAPRNRYGLTKAMQTQLAFYFRLNHPESLRVTVAHLFNLIGPGSPERLAFGSFVRQIALMNASGTLRTGNLSSRRDFLHVTDAATALAAISSLAEPAPSYVVASGRSTGIHDLLDHLVRVSGRHIQVEADPARSSPTDVPSICGSSDRLSAETGWRPLHTAESAIEQMWKEVSA
jgi:GDP-4-dehydro-6-deoxy-D-mannose reductase